MATKHNCSCLEKAADDEPIFVLRAQDLTAPIAVVFWILLQLLFGAVEYLRWDKGAFALVRSQRNSAKLAEALHCALAMAGWSNKKLAD